MILSNTPWLKLEETYAGLSGFFDFRHKKWVLCPEIIHEFFELSEDVRYIRFVAHSHPGQCRVKLEFDLDSRWEWTDEFHRVHVSYNILADGEEVGFHAKAQTVIERLLRKHKKIYVECLYED